MERKFSKKKYNFLRMYKNFKNQFIRFVLLSCGCSLVFALAKKFLHFFRTTAAYSAISTVIIIITTVMFFNWLREYRMTISGIKRYFVTNLTIIGILCGVAVLFFVLPFIGSNYIWLFFHYAFFSFLFGRDTVSRLSSSLLVSLYYIVLVLITPIITSKHKALKKQKTRKSRNAYLLNTDTSRDNYSGYHHHHHHHSTEESEKSQADGQSSQEQ